MHSLILFTILHTMFSLVMGVRKKTYIQTWEFDGKIIIFDENINSFLIWHHHKI